MEKTMKFSVGENDEIIIEEVYNPIILRTNDGEELTICMRDSGFELEYDAKTKWCPTNLELKNGEIESTIP